MSLRIRSIVGSAAVAGLVIAGTVAASATDPVTIEKVGYFEVQGDSEVAGANNLVPDAWFSEHDDDVAGISFGEDGVTFAASPKAVGLNKIVDIPLDDLDLAVDATGTTRLSLVIESDAVDYLRITADDLDASQWNGTGYYLKDDEDRTPYVAKQSLTEWANEGFLGGNAKVTLIGARHHSGEGEGTLRSITAGGTKYVFGLIEDLEDDLAAANAAKAALQNELDAAELEIAGLEDAVADADAEIAELKDEIATAKNVNAGQKAAFDEAIAEFAQKMAEAGVEKAAVEAALAAAEKAADEAAAAAEKQVADLQGELAAAVKAAQKAGNQALAAQARAPYRITGKAAAGNTLRVKGKSYKGVNVKYQWYVGGKKAGKKATLKLKKAHANKKVRVVVTKSFTRANGKTATVTQVVKLTSATRVAR